MRFSKGSILEPTLFRIFITDITDVINSQLAIYVDHTIIYTFLIS